MELIDAITKRRSVRRFKDKDVPMEIIMKSLEYGNLAPSAGNLQARDFIIVRDKKIKKELMIAALHQSFVEECPVVIVVCANMKRISPYGERGKKLYALQDCAAAIQNMLLYLTSEGVGSCWVGAFNEKKVYDILNLPSSVRPVAIIPIGYPEDKGRQPPRMKIEDLVHYDMW